MRIAALIFSLIGFWGFLVFINEAVYHFMPVTVSAGPEGGMIDAAFSFILGGVASLVALVFALVHFWRFRGTRFSRLLIAWCCLVLLGFVLVLVLRQQIADMLPSPDKSHKKLKDAWEYLILSAIASTLSGYWLITGKIGMGSRYRFGAGVTFIRKNEDAYQYQMWVGLFVFLSVYTLCRGVLALRCYLRHRKRVMRDETRNG